MTSEEIKAIGRVERFEDLVFWARECAYQLAVQVEVARELRGITERLAGFAKLQGELDAANQHVKILQQITTPSAQKIATEVAASIRSCAQTIMENRMDGPMAVGYLVKYADAVAVSVPSAKRSEQPPPPQPGEASPETGSGHGMSMQDMERVRAELRKIVDSWGSNG